MKERTIDKMCIRDRAHTQIFGGGLLGTRAVWSGTRAKKYKRD